MEKVINLKDVDFIVGTFFEEKQKSFNNTLNVKYESLEPNGLQTWIAKTMNNMISDKDNLLAKLETASFESKENNNQLIPFESIKKVIDDAFKDISKDSHFPGDNFLFVVLKAMETVKQYWQRLHTEQFIAPENTAYINPLELG